MNTKIKGNKSVIKEAVLKDLKEFWWITKGFLLVSGVLFWVFIALWKINN